MPLIEQNKMLPLFEHSIQNLILNQHLDIAGNTYTVKYMLQSEQNDFAGFLLTKMK